MLTSKCQYLGSRDIEHCESIEKSSTDVNLGSNMHKENGGKIVHANFILPHSWSNMVVSVSHTSRDSL